MIQPITTSIIYILHNLYNICWFKGYFPNNWKNPKTILLNKPGKSKKDPNNYRPITLINCLSKIMEKIIKTKLTQYVETNNIINDEHAGFRAKKGTNDKLFQLTQIATQAKNRKQACASVYMDVEKTFDKVWHNGLLHTMDQHNIPHIFQRFISSFLSNRHIQTHQNQPWSTTRIVTQPNTLHHICSKSPKTTTNSPHLTIRRRHQNILILKKHPTTSNQTTKVTKQNSSILWKVQDQLKRKQNNRADHYWTSTQIHQGIHPSTPNTQETNTNH